MTVEPQVSIMEPMRRKRTRAISVPRAHRSISTDFAPNPWVSLEPLGEQVARTTSALAELAVLTHNNPETWYAQGVITESITHDFLTATNKSWNDGIEHGKWLCAEELINAYAEIEMLRRNIGEVDRLRGELHRISNCG